MTLTLPLRGRVSPTLTLDPIFSLLYEDNEKNLKHLIDNKAPLPLHDVVHNSEFMEYLLNKEPGPKVEYANLRPALTAMRAFLIMSPHGKKLLAFYKHLLQLQGRWAVAVAEMLTFNIYLKLTQVLYIDRDDKKLMAHIIKLVPDAAFKIATYTTGDRRQFSMMVKSEKDRLLKETRAAAENLFNLKVSNDFWNQHGKLVAAIEHSEKKLQESRERHARRKHERLQRVLAAQARNEATLSRQMGMAGMTPHLPHVENSVCEYTRELREDYFRFDGNIVS